MTYIQVGISRDRDGPRERIRVLVDTGAFHSMIQRGTLAKLGIEPEERREFRMANGKKTTRSVGRMYIHHGGRSAETFVIFGGPRDEVVLGSYALEGLELEVDPKSNQVRHVKVIPLVAVGPA